MTQLKIEEMKALGFKIRDADTGVYENGHEAGSISVQKFYDGPRPWRAYRRGHGWLRGKGRRSGTRSFSDEVKAARAALEEWK